MLFETERLTLRQLVPDDTPDLLDFELRNRMFFAPWEPDRGRNYYTSEFLKNLIEKNSKSNFSQRSLILALFLKDEARLAGFCSLTNIIYGPFLSCFLGYRLDKSCVGRGYMTEAVGKVVDVAFTRYRLHRIEANVMPRNTRSIAVLKRLGFKNEGLSQAYIKINGVWEDHLHYVRLNPEV